MMRFAADLFWFNEIGYQRVFATELLTKVLLFVIVGAGDVRAADGEPPDRAAR